VITPEERRALEAVAKYGTVKEAAQELGKSPHTIERQLESARRRLGVTTTIAAYRKSREAA
jgi:DNA-binding transcriptional LysR family regulator